MLRKALVLIILVCFSVTVYAQTKPRLAILPITGGTGSDGETIAELFSFEAEINRVFVPIPRTSSIESIMREQQFQRSTGLTDSDTIARLGRQYNADYVVAGHIQVLGNSKLIIITIIHVESLQQIAGDYREYRNIEEIQGMISDMARRIARASQINRTNLSRLAVLPFSVPASGVNQGDAEVLAQLLATEVANSGRYAVLPRTSQIQAVMAEHEIQRSGITEGNSIRAIGQALNAQYVLAGNVRRLGQTNMFTVQILEVESASLITGSAENYSTISDGLTMMASLSGRLTGAGVVTTNTPAAVTTNTPAPAVVPQNSGNFILLSTTVWLPNTDDRSTARISESRINFSGQMKDALTVEINLANGISRWAGCTLRGDSPSAQRLRTGSGVRFKVMGDGKTWILCIPTTETMHDSGFFQKTFTTRRNTVVEVNIPYSQLRQPEWGQRARFNRNSITGIDLQRNNNLEGAGASTITIFDFEIY